MSEAKWSWRWIAPTSGRRTNIGRRRSSLYPTEEAAKIGAIQSAVRSEKPLDPELIELLWRNLERAGWIIEDVGPNWTSDRW